MDVSIIIVNYNTKVLTTNCIKSILEKTKNISVEIIVVDNASSDGSQTEIKSLFPGVIVIESDQNVGFGRANNLAVTFAKGKFLFFLNSDTLLVENSIFKLWDFFIQNENKLKLGVLGCILVDEDSTINGFGSSIPTLNDFNREILFSFPIVKHFKKPKVKSYPLKESFFEVGYVLGADMFMRTTLFKDVGGFDPKYFMYFEESDLQIAVLKKNLLNYIYTGTQIIHLEGRSFTENKRISNQKRIIVHTSKILYAKKNFLKGYFSFKALDITKLLLNIFNFKFYLSENIIYIKKILKTY